MERSGGGDGERRKGEKEWDLMWKEGRKECRRRGKTVKEGGDCKRNEEGM